MIRGKTRHQLFLPDELSKRLAAMAKSQKRARSDLLVEIGRRVDELPRRTTGRRPHHGPA